MYFDSPSRRRHIIYQRSPPRSPLKSIKLENNKEREDIMTYDRVAAKKEAQDNFES